MWGSVNNRPPTDPRHPPTASQVVSKEGFFPPIAPRDTITINQEKRMSVFDSFTLPDELGKSKTIEKQFNEIFFSLISHSTNKNIKEKTCTWKGTIRPIHFIHLYKNIVSPANLRDSSTTYNYFLLSYQKNSSSPL